MRSRRYVAWLDRHSRSVLIGAVLAIVGSAYLAAFHLPLRSDFSHLLPSDAPAVRDAERLAQRMPARDTMIAIVMSPDPAARAQAGAKAVAAIRAIDPDLVHRVEADDDELRAFVQANQHLFVPLADLETARAALATTIAEAKRRANPLLVDLDDPPPPDRRLDDLRAKQRAAEAKLARSPFVSDDGRLQVIVIRTAFQGTDVERDIRLMKQLDAIALELRAEHPLVTMGFAGGPPVTVAEHRALTRGMVLSSAITMLLVALVLFAHLRSVRMLVLLSANLACGTLVAFGIAALTIGQLNAATAFLGAIIAGNGVNYGILLVARYLEERRRAQPREALATAIAGTLRPTLVASFGAAVAYGALLGTQFRGFADFAWIGGIGMLVCWACSFVVLPVLVLRFARGNLPEPSHLFGGLVTRVFGFRKPALVCALAGTVTLGASIVTWRYLADDPYEYDMSQLRSKASDAVQARQWLRVSDETFGRGLAGLAGQTFVAVDREDQIPQVVDALTALAAREPIVGKVVSILDVIPRDQQAKLAVLADLRRQIDGALELVDESERGELLAHRPPDGLDVITRADLPPALAAKLTERDGRVGYVIAVKPSDRFDERDGRDLIAFADAVRQVRLESGETVSTAGASVLFADVLLQIQRDGPLITAIALAGLVVVVLLVAGPTRRSAAVLLATAIGSVAMIAVCALLGIKINFLDFVALPITLGLGVDYAINVADRATRDDPMTALRSTGGTVLVCSLTTIIGYASLLVSDNLSIRGFGLASLIGEITCVVAALLVVPAIVALPAFAGRRVIRDAATSV